MRSVAATVACVLGLATGLPVSQAAGRDFLWSVAFQGGPPTYLLGSLHVLTAEHYPLSETIERAFAASTVLIEEIDFAELGDPAKALALAGRAMLADGRTLDQVVSAATYAQVVARSAQDGIPLAALRRMKPWMAAITLTAPALTSAGFDPDLGVDRYFFDKAQANGMERRALETVAYQLDRFDQLDPALQEVMLQAVLEDVDTQIANVTAIVQAWEAGDTAALERLLLAAFLESPALYERLLVERNRNWVAPVERCLIEGTGCFVVVGAAHLVGPHSLVALLGKRGYTVIQQ